VKDAYPTKEFERKIDEESQIDFFASGLPDPLPKRTNGSQKVDSHDVVFCEQRFRFDGTCRRSSATRIA
jgi:hypothetical protein